MSGLLPGGPWSLAFFTERKEEKAQISHAKKAHLYFSFGGVSKHLGVNIYPQTQRHASKLPLFSAEIHHPLKFST